MNRYREHQIREDMNNQEWARQLLANYMGIEVRPQGEMSTWDWEFYVYDDLMGFGEYRRRFNNFDTYEDFQFTKSKFVKMKGISQLVGLPAVMVVHFNDCIKFFEIAGNPEVAVMRRNHEVRKENCVRIPKEWFKPIELIDRVILF